MLFKVQLQKVFSERPEQQLHPLDKQQHQQQKRETKRKEEKLNNRRQHVVPRIVRITFS